MSECEVVINGETYVKKSSVNVPAATLAGMKYCIVRTYSAGVFAGYVKQRNGKEVTMLQARRLWYWSGAASLSQLAMEGVKNQEACKFPCEVTSVELTEAIEIIKCTQLAKDSIAGVKVWEK